MKMTIIEHWPEAIAFDGSRIPAKDTSYTMPGESGWQSVAEMQRELIRRFKHRDPVLIPNGVRMKETYYEQSVTLQ